MEIVYTVEETAVDAYDEPVYSELKQTGENTYEIEITNTYVPETTETEVEKVWEDKGYENKRPESIVMELTADGETVTMVTLNEDNGWKATVAGLPKYKNGQPIAYNWDETAVPAGYEKTIEVDEDGKTTITNRFLTGALVIEKTFSENVQDLEAVKDLTFTITGPDFEQTVKYSEFTNGVYTIEGLVPGVYSVVEENAFELITDYSLDVVNSKIAASATVTSGDPAEITLSNIYTEDEGSLIIMKAFCGVPKKDTPWSDEAKNLTFTVVGVNAAGEEIYNETFTLADLVDDITNESANLVKMKTIEHLKPGTYTVTESGAEGIITGYTLNLETSVTEAAVTIVKGGVATAVLKNNYPKDQASLVIEKTFIGTDEVDESVLKALAFHVTGSDLVNDETYDETFYYAQFEDGKLTLTGLTPGTYTVEETNAETLIANYTLIATENDGPATIRKDETGTIKVTNTYAEDKGELKITKTVTGAPETEADKEYSFTVQNAEGKYIALDGSESTAAVILTVKSGETVTIPDLPVGRYTVTELLDSTVIADYTLEASSVTTGAAEVTITAAGEVELKNDYSQDLGVLRVTKQAIGAPDGMEFQLAVKNADGVYFTVKGTEADEDTKWVTLKSGETAAWENLPVGTYTVEEADAKVDGLTLTVTGTGETTVWREAETLVTVVNNYTDDLGDLVLTKTFTGLPEDADTAHLAFSITGPHGYEQTVYYVQFVDGSYTIKNLPVGEYHVTETNAGELIMGYTLLASTTEGTGEVTKGEQATVALENNYEQDLGTLIISKTFNGVPEDADVDSLSFTVTNSDGETVATVTYGEFTDGQYKLTDLPVGIYTVTETNAEGLIANYTLAATSVTTGTGEVEKGLEVTVALTNNYEPNFGELVIEKIFSGVPEGADVDSLSFTVTNSEGETVATVTYGEFTDGQYKLTDLPEGTYTITETNADGLIAKYNLAASSITTGTGLVVGLETVTVRLLNVYEPQLGSLKLVKNFAGTPDDAILDGLNFHITGPDGYTLDVSYAAFTGGEYTLENIPVGTYTVTETNADTLIANYKLTAASVTTGEAEVKEGETAVIELLNEYEELLGSLTIVKTFSGLLDSDDVSHLTFRIIGPDGFDETVTYGEFKDGSYTLTGLKPGPYLVYETNAHALAYTLTLLPTSVTAAQTTVVAEQESKVSLVNDYDNAVTSVMVMKIWNDMDDLDGSRPETIVMTLHDGDTVVDTVTLSEENGWTAEITGLPLADAAGNTINYTWTEETVTGYTLSSQLTLGNMTIFTNTHKPELTSTTVIKVWDDNKNAAGRRPTVLRVKLSTGDEYYLSEDNDWTVTVEGLPKYKDGVEIEYTWSEQSIVGYTQTSVKTIGTVTTFTNKYRVPTVPTPPEEPKPLIVEVIINHVGDCYD